MKNNKGFTLIELMIAIAIIGILALVLIPRVAGVKNQAREAGLDTNARMAASIAEALVDKVNGNESTDLQGLEAAIAGKLTESAMKNPLTKSADVATDLTSGGAFAYVVDTDETADANYDGETTANTAIAGTILFDAYLDANNAIKVQFVPYDSKGLPVTGSVVTTN